MDFKELFKKFSKEMVEGGICFIFKQADHGGFHMKFRDEGTIEYVSYNAGGVHQAVWRTLALESLRTFKVIGIDLPSTGGRLRISKTQDPRVRPMREYLIIHVR